MNTFVYRLAEKRDIDHLEVLYQQIYLDTYGDEGITGELINFIRAQFSKEKIAHDLDDPDQVLWVATFKENLIGLLKLAYHKPCPLENFSGPEINKLYLLRHFFGKGVAGRLMQIAEAELKLRRESAAWLWLLDSNLRALNFYKKQGYEEIGIAYFQMEVNRYRNIVMRKKL